MSSLSMSSVAASKPAYFEFLLKPSMLEEHLCQPDPNPSAIDLMIQMVYNSLRRSATEQTIGNQSDVYLMQRKGHMLVVLSLRILAHLKYDVQLLLDKVPLEICDALLNYLMGESLGPLSSELTPSCCTVDLATLLPYQIHAACVYYRYVVAAVVESRRPRPSQHRSATISLPGVCGESEYREDREPLLAELTSKADFAARILDTLVLGATQVCEAVPNSFSLSLPGPGAEKGSTHNFTNCREIPLHQFKCQVHYDLGLFHFVTERYSEALHNFTEATTLFPQCQENPDECKVRESELRCYQRSCSAVCGRSTPLHHRTLLDRFTHAITPPAYQGLLEVLSADDVSHELPRYLRLRLQVDLKAAPPHAATQRLYFQVCCHNVVRSVMEGKVWDPCFPGSLVTAGKQGAVYLLQLLSCKVSSLSASERDRVHQLLVCLNLQEGVSAVLVPPLMATAPLASLFTHQEMIDMWHGVEQEKEAKLVRQSIDVNYGVETADEDSLVWELIHSYDPVALRRSVTRYTQQTTAGGYKDVLDLNDKWEVPSPIRSSLVKIPSTLHRHLISLFVAKSHELLLSKSWSESCDLLDVALKACGEISDGDAGRLYKLLTLLKLTHNIQKWTHGLPHNDEGGTALANEAQINLISTRVREDLVLWRTVRNWCLLCLVNAREWGSALGAATSMQFVNNSMTVAAFLCPLVAAALTFDSSGPIPPTPQMNQSEHDRPFLLLWDIFVKAFDAASIHKKTGNGGGSSNNGGKNSNNGGNSKQDVLSLTEILDTIYSIKEPTCLSIIISLLGVMYNKVLGEPSAELHTQYPQLWITLSAGKDCDLVIVRDALAAVVDHATKYFPGADHVSEATATSWHMTAADLAYVAEEPHKALGRYLTAVFIATHFLRSEPPDEATNHLVSDTATRKMVRCCMNIGCYTQAGLLCQFLDPIDYSTALRCLQDRSGVDGVDAYYDTLWDVTLMEFIINAHHKKGEIQRRDAVLKVIGQLELNSNNNEEIQREAAKVRKHRLLRALAKQYLV